MIYEPRIHDPGDLAHFDCCEIAAFSGEENLGELTQEQADVVGGSITWSVFLHRTVGHVVDLADGFATRDAALAFAFAVEQLLPNRNKNLAYADGGQHV